MDHLDIALAAAISSYAITSNEEVETQSPAKNDSNTAAPKKRGRPVKAEKVEAPPVIRNPAPPPTKDPLPAKGSITAEQFLSELPNCGKRRNSNGVFVFQNNHIARDDEQKLIAGFIGWDKAKLHGIQLQNARLEAYRQIQKPAPLPENYKRRAGNLSTTVKGYVSGSHDANEIKKQDLLARERNSAEKLTELENNIKKARSGHERSLFQGLLALEEERIQAIRQDLQKLGVSLTIQE